jgi:uncharacterized protein
MLGEQDPASAHGFNIYYTGLAPGAFKRQPPFMGADASVYSTDYNNFSCDDGTGMETQAKYADTVYSRDAGGLFVNLFIPSDVVCDASGLTLRQTTGFPDEPGTHLAVIAGRGAMALRIRVPAWVAGPARAWLNGHPAAVPTRAGNWLVIDREWRQGDTVDVSLPMRLELEPTPDEPGVRAATYGPIVLSGGYGRDAATAVPWLDAASLTRISGRELAFQARTRDRAVKLIPVARTHHEHYNVYWRT